MTTTPDAPGLFIVGGVRPLTADPVEAVRDCIVFGSRDWGRDRDLAWIYGIVVGWECGLDDDAAIKVELQQKFGWTDANWARMVELHERLSQGSGEA